MWICSKVWGMQYKYGASLCIAVDFWYKFVREKIAKSTWVKIWLSKSGHHQWYNII